jgi:Domain of unknown function (DUF4907)
MNEKMKLFAVSIAIILCMSCTNSDSAKEDNTVIQQPAANKEISSDTKVILEVKTYQNDSAIKEWGYDIYADGVLYIHQPHIPAVPGNKGFQSVQKAETAGNFAVYKIRNNILPPTISVVELDSLGLIK